MIKNIFKREKEETEKYTKKDIPFLILVSLITIFTASMPFVAPAQGVGTSMMPTYRDGVIYSRNLFFKKSDLKIGKVVTFQLSYEDTLFCKRIVAGPGDTVSVKDDQLYVNGKLSEYQFGKTEGYGVLQMYPEFTLKEDEWFVLGDNREDSRDSRNFGPVKTEQISSIIRCKLF